MIYGNKHVVFEQVGVDNTSVWNSASNVDGDSCSNNYEISDIRNTLSQTILPKLSDELTSELVSTTIQTAKNGNSTTLVSTDDKIFLPAGKEISVSPSYCVSQEDNSLTTWTYWTTHTSSSDRIKYDSTSTAKSYWLRSPRSSNTFSVVIIYSNGNFNAYSADFSYWIVSCFAW